MYVFKYLLDGWAYIDSFKDSTMSDTLHRHFPEPLHVRAKLQKKKKENNRMRHRSRSSRGRIEQNHRAAGEKSFIAHTD